jgi:nuclear pore complex protein Nup133
VQSKGAEVLLVPDSGYQDRLELKSATDRTLGVGVVEDAGVLFVLTATTMMKACVDMEKVASIGPE